jgi:hypothetical protein
LRALQPTLEVADGTLAELRALGQFHLSETARTPVMPQDICKYQFAITELLHHGPQPSGIGSASSEFGAILPAKFVGSRHRSAWPRR